MQLSWYAFLIYHTLTPFKDPRLSEKVYWRSAVLYLRDSFAPVPSQGTYSEMLAARLLKNAAAYELSLSEPNAVRMHDEPLALDEETDEVIAASISNPLFAARIANAKRWRATVQV